MADFYYYPDSSGMYTLNFFDNSTGSPTNFYWSFGDSTFSTLQNPTHTFSKGTYEVCLTISDSATNCYDTYCSWLYLDDSNQTNKCDAYFSYYDSNLTVYFSGFVKTSSSKIIQYDWDFGDNKYGTGQNPVHTYSANGQYLVILETMTIDSLNDTCISKYYEYINLGQQQRGYIYGTISSKSYSVDKAIVYLISFNAKDSTLTAVDSMYAMDSGGVAFYYFDVAFGDYLVKAALTPSSTNYSHCIPTYYGDVLFWNQATTVNVNSQNPYATANIVMLNGTNPAGPGFIGGKTSKGANIWLLNPGVPMQNVEVLLLDQSGAPISYDFSESTGDFAFKSLPFGTYQVYAEVPGKNTIPAIVTIDAQTPSISNIQIIITEEGVKTSVKTDLSESVEGAGSIYPNPVHSMLKIDFSIKKSVSINVQIINTAGQIMDSRVVRLNAGKNTLSLDTWSLPQGIYNLSIKSDDGANISRSFTLIK
jgi:PKD repeat protein